MKKLLLLLILSVTTFASAQTINVAELTVPGLLSPTFHVYDSGSEGAFEYPEGTVSSISSFTVDGRVLTTAGDDYTMSIALATQARDRMNGLGHYGLFFSGQYGPAWNIPASREPSFFLPDDIVQHAAFAAEIEANPNRWSAIHAGTIPNHFRYQDDCYRYEAVLTTSDNQWHIDFWKNGVIDRRWPGYLPSYATSELAVARIKSHIETLPRCESCTGADAAYDDLNDLIAAEGFEASGFTAWINRVGNANRWDRIEIDGDRFVLEIDTGSEGRVGIRTTYDCLEDLISDL